MEPQTDFAHSAGDWILNSGIQEATGGVARYYLTDRQKNAAVSTEITGYSASTLLHMYRCTGDLRFLDAARKAADYLTRAWQTDASAMPFECDRSIPQYTYFFDNGIIVRGLLAAWRTCGDATSLVTAKRIAGSMRQDFRTGQEFSPILTFPYLELLNLSVSTHNVFLPGADSEALVMGPTSRLLLFLGRSSSCCTGEDFR